MKRAVPLLIAALVVVAALVGGVGSAVATGDDGTEPDVSTAAATENATTTNETNTTDTDVAAGAQLAGIIGAQQAEHTSAVETKTFDVALDRADSNDTKAAVVANRTERLEDRLQALETASARLENQYDNETITRDAYVGQMTALNARVEALQRQVNQTRTRSTTLPAPVLAAQGVNRSDLDELTNRSVTVVSPHAATVAKTVAGSNVGQPVGPPEDVPTSDHAGGTADSNRETPGAGGTDSRAADRSNRSAGNQSDNETTTPGQNRSEGPTQGPTDVTTIPGVANGAGAPDHRPDGATGNGSTASPPGQNGSTPPGFLQNETVGPGSATDNGAGPQSMFDAVLAYFG